MIYGVIHAIALAGRVASKQGTLTQLLAKTKQTDSSQKNKGEGLFDICVSPLRNVASAKPASYQPM